MGAHADRWFRRDGVRVHALRVPGPEASSRQGSPPRQGERRRGGRFLELPHPAVSQVHAELIILGGRVYLRDLDSANGMFIVRRGSLERFSEGYVELDTPLQFGECRTTLQALFEEHVANGAS